MKSPLNITISRFQNYFSSEDSKPENLMSWLTSAEYADKVKQIRNIDDKDRRDRLKADLPGITPSGTFTYRNENSLIEHSGLIQFDIDGKDNADIGNYAELKKHISNIENVAYCGLSVSGKGYWGLVPIKHPDRHRSHYMALHKAFLKLRLKIDTAPSNVASLRGYSYDPDGYFNHNAKVFSSLDEQPARKIQRTHFNNDTKCKVEALIERIQASSFDITSSYDEWLRIGFAFADEFGEAGRNYFHAVSQYHPDYNERECDRQYTHCLKSHGSGITISTFFYLAQQFQINDYPYIENKKEKVQSINYTSYPKSWDEIKHPEPRSQEDFESVKATIQDAEPHELKLLMHKDPLIKEIFILFDAEIADDD